MIAATSMIDRLAELIAIRSTADRPAELRRALDLVIAEAGTGFVVRRFESNGKPSALLTPAGAGPLRVILNAHLDVVPAADEQFVPRRDGDRLYGRGAHDMKAAALVLTAVFREAAATLPYPIGLQLVTDEEVGGADGTGHQLAQGVRAGFVVIGEQSALRVVTESKGICQARLTTTGRAAHAAYPWLGSNALLTLHTAISRLLARHPVPAAEDWVTTVNVARITTPNQAYNQVPAAAEAWLDIRFPPTDPDFAGRDRAEIAAHLSGITGVPAVVDALGPPHHADPDGPGVRALREAIRATGHPADLLRKHGAADGRYYHALGIDAVIFGPSGDGQHGPAEYVDLRSLRPYRDALRGFLDNLAKA
ncbi:M20/M25/M40 family metallo-hydrolase [Actinoplanes sp. KI2]|uniref:M20 family metallopeptidase n=1 Tax=Actinoplanes sp. KI2 TaxID=2983315 RepID=UPI0021D59EA3|nr:M20/M25/M40 family metallo-hydrolase [Actinoplanes sp. KI2]MCU7727367.1 M20/M25/M40 family metallo-hydrolase [Actinoplanes sp. KI2]